MAPFLLVSSKKYKRNVAAFAVRLRLYQREENKLSKMISSKNIGGTMKRIATVALMLIFGVAGVYAQQNAVRMAASGTLEDSNTSLLPNTRTDEQNLAGNGTLEPFTFRELH